MKFTQQSSSIPRMFAKTRCRSYGYAKGKKSIKESSTISSCHSKQDVLQSSKDLYLGLADGKKLNFSMD